MYNSSTQEGGARLKYVMSYWGYHRIALLYYRVWSLKRVSTNLRVGYGRRRWSTAGGPVEVQQRHLARRTAVDWAGVAAADCQPQSLRRAPPAFPLPCCRRLAASGWCSPATCRCCISRSSWTASSTRCVVCSTTCKCFGRLETVMQIVILVNPKKKQCIISKNELIVGI